MFATLRSLLSRTSALFRGRRLDEEFEREVVEHIALLREENIRRGMASQEAHYAAIRSFGGVTQAKESHRQNRGLWSIENVIQDLRYALRGLRNNPGFTTVAVATLALGIGANTAIFQLLDAIRIRSLPVSHPEELMEINLADTTNRRGSVSRFGEMSNPLWERIRGEALGKDSAFSQMLAWGERQSNVGSGVEARYAKTLMVSGDFFNVLGVRPHLGRLFSSEDDRRGCGVAVAVVSYSFWQRQFGGNPAVIGSKLLLDSQPAEVVGVTPPDFFGMEVGESYDVAVPICAEAALRGENTHLDDGTFWWLVIMGRLKPGASRAMANAQLKGLSPGIFRETLPANYPKENVKNYLAFQLAASPAGRGISKLRNDYADSLWLLLGAAGMVLLIACANLANLMLVRAGSRQREISVRLALGASRGRLVQQLMTESLALAIAGSILGLWLAQAASRFMISLLTVSGSGIVLDLRPDWRVLGFNAALAVATCLLFGMMPAMRASATDPGAAMKSAGRTASAGRERFGFRRALVVAQVSLSLVLLAGALLFSRSLRNLLHIDPGFRQKGILVVSLDCTQLHISQERRIRFQEELLERIKAVPGVEGAANTDIIPISGDSWSNNVWMDTGSAGGAGGVNASLQPVVLFNSVSVDYFRIMEIPRLSGRTFNALDTATSPRVAMVNEAFARQLTSGANPVGKRFWRQATPRQPQALYEIVGVVKNTKYMQLQESFRPIAYMPSTQDPNPNLDMNILVRSGQAPSAVISSLKRTVAEISPAIVLDYDVLRIMVESSLLRERLMAWLAGIFGVLAALLAAIGIYGVTSFMVRQRTNEIGIRMALGADRARVLGLIMREAAILLGIGVVAGAALALAAAGTADTFIFGLKARDPLTLISATGLLGLAALTAGYVPARRAAQLDPVEALREE